MKMKEDHLEKLLDRTLYFAIGFRGLGNGERSHIILGIF